MSAPSFQRFDYVLRTNKAIERKLFFDVVYSAKKEFKLSAQWYLGFGSMWFNDFKIAHRLLHLDDMISIEHEPHAARAEFNRPFSTIKVIGGESGEVLENRVNAALWTRPLVAWLDYDGRLNESVVLDLSTLLQKSARDSIVAVTVNGARGTYRPKPTSFVSGSTSSRNGAGVVAAFLGISSAPKEFLDAASAPGPTGDVSDNDFPRFLGSYILNYMWHTVVSLARKDADGEFGFKPLFLMHHKDNADMVTVGGAIISEASRKKWDEMFKAHTGLSDEKSDVKYCVMDLAPVTLREKITLDRHLPNSLSVEEYEQAVISEGVRLEVAEVEKYRKFYRQFPLFMEASY
ncbi:O-methyltransferase [Xanthomonas sp. BRIP62418]|uniref:O-methyltransferase n=1 Tax=Xanthomonas sp. BRIP62418 TaxID=2182391 RepID=UPI000F8D6AA5|nr:O-methyltransferase [Xanthomonas sp. BRIP62418]